MLYSTLKRLFASRYHRHNDRYYTKPEIDNIIANNPGPVGQDGETPFIGGNGNWWIGTTDTGVQAQGSPGTPGADGDTPFIGGNGNWWVGTTDTGVQAQGDQGEPGVSGIVGVSNYLVDALTTSAAWVQLGNQVPVTISGTKALCHGTVTFWGLGWGTIGVQHIGSGLIYTLGGDYHAVNTSASTVSGSAVFENLTAGNHAFQLVWRTHNATNQIETYPASYPHLYVVRLIIQEG